MKKKITLLKMTLLAAILIITGSTNVWGQTETLTITVGSINNDSNQLKTNNYNSGAQRIWAQTDQSENTINFGGKAITQGPGTNTGTIQAQQNNGVIYNTSPLPGKIVSITLSLNGTPRASSCYGGNTSRLVNDVAAEYDVIDGTQVGEASESGWTSTDFSGTNYTYFAIKRGTYTAYFTEIVIEYETTSTDPAIIANPSSLSFNNIVVGAAPAEDLVEVTGANLTADITTSITGADAAMFDIDKETITITEGATSEVLVVSYTPATPGNHTATLTLTSGQTTETIPLTGSAILAAPEALDATNVTSDSFTAVWKDVQDAEKYKVNVYTKNSEIASETEGFDNVVAAEGGTKIESATYLDGWSALSQSTTRQIYTTTGNSGISPPSFAFTITGDYVETATYSAPITKFSFWAKRISATTNNSTTLIQGYNGSEWQTIANISNEDIVEAGIITYNLSELNMTDIIKIKMTYTKDGGNLAVDDITVEYNSEVITPVTGSPFTVTGQSTTRHDVTGLTNSTTYYYTVKAIAEGGIESGASNEIEVTTDSKTGLDKATAGTHVYASHGKVHFSAAAGQIVEIYNVAGQKLISRPVVEGLNSVDVPATGVVFVKIGERVTKVIL